jgi:hypothetical protein
MAVREFTDSGGREWRVWDVFPESIHPQTRAEDYLADMYRTGWLVFETKAEDEKRRLAAFPAGWSELPSAGLATLLARAEVIPPLKLRSLREVVRGAEAARQQERAVRRAEELADLPPTARARVPEEERPDVTDLGVARTLHYPGGQFWTVLVIQHPEGGGVPVLRFTTGARDIDLKDWPKEWADYPDERLVELLRRAAPRARGQVIGADTPRRRYDDPPRGAR